VGDRVDRDHDGPVGIRVRLRGPDDPDDVAVLVDRVDAVDPPVAVDVGAAHVGGRAETRPASDHEQEDRQGQQESQADR
jgi:hypothetical protein